MACARAFEVSAVQCSGKVPSHDVRVLVGGLDVESMMDT